MRLFKKSIFQIKLMYKNFDIWNLMWLQYLNNLMWLQIVSLNMFYDCFLINISPLQENLSLTTELPLSVGQFIPKVKRTEISIPEV